MESIDTKLIWRLCLYIAGETSESEYARHNIEEICRDYLEGEYSLKIIDLLKQPELAEKEQILAVPTLVKRYPEPVRKIIGDLSNKEKVIEGLGLRKKVRN